METTRYEQVRLQLKTGDLIGFHHGGLWDWLICWWTKSRYNHVALVVVFEVEGVLRVLLHNAEPSTGVSLIPASLYLARYAGQAWWCPLDDLKAQAINPDYATAIKAHIWSTLGRAYNWQGIAKFVLPWVRQRSDEDFCSQLAAEDLNAGGILQNTFVSPGSLVGQPIFRPGEAL